MRVTVFRLSAGDVDPQASETPAWQPSVFEDHRVDGVDETVLHSSQNGTILMIQLEAGSRFPMHSGADYAFCQVVRGRGKVGLPHDRDVGYNGPELFIFEPGTLHDWHDIEEDTLLSICLVKKD